MTELSTTIKTPMPVRNADTVRRLLISRKAIPGRTWRYLAENVYWPVPPGTLYAIANGLAIPNKYRRVFKLPPVVKVPACPLCGIAHLYDCRTQEVKPKTNGRPKRRKRQPFRPCLPQVTDAQRAAILAMTPDERLEKLLK